MLDGNTHIAVSIDNHLLRNLFNSIKSIKQHQYRVRLKLNLSRQRIQYEIVDAAKSDWPDANEQTPKLIFDRSRIFQPKYRDVLWNDGRIEKQEAVCFYQISKEADKRAKTCRKISAKIIDCIEKMDDWNPNHGIPTNCRNLSISKHSLCIAAEVFKPDDSVKQKNV